MKIDICHIYPITSGTAGTYMDGIYNALKSSFSQMVFVNNYYPFNYGKKWFYKYSDLSSQYYFLKKHNTLRRAIRFVELIVGLIRTYVFIVNNKVKVVNYSLNSDLSIEYLFLSALKKHHIKIVITCHDVLPFGVSLEGITKSKKYAKKKKFFELADFLLIHNENSKSELNRYYGISGNKVISSPFPIMDINIFYKENSLPDKIRNFLSNSSFLVAMVGYFRSEKGLKILIDAWKIFCTTNVNAQLVIAGFFPNKEDLSIISGSNSVCVYEDFLSDSAYAELIKKSNVVVMPYLRGTNSGIPSSIASMGTCVVSSDIEMFKNSPFISECAMFESGNSESLARKLSELYQNRDNINNRIEYECQQNYKNYQALYSKILIKSYKRIVN